MAFKSPGIYFREIDNTEYTNPAAEINTTVAIVGFAKKGPIGVPTEITSYNDFKSTFGSPIAGQYAGLAVRSVLSAGGSVLYTRIADDTLATSSSVILKTSVEAADGMLVVNSKSNITVGTEGYFNKTLYTGVLEDSTDDTINKTMILRSPSSGKFQLNEILKQLNSSLAENYGFTEYVLKNTISGSRRSFSLNVNGTNSETNEAVKETIGPYFIDIYNNEDGSSLASSLNQVISNGTTPYQKFEIWNSALENSADNDNTDLTFSTEALGLNRAKYINVSLEGQETKQVSIPLITTNTVTAEELAKKFSIALSNFGITAEYVWNVKNGKPYFLFSSTNNTGFTLLPFTDSDGVPKDTSLFVPYAPKNPTAADKLSEMVYLVSNGEGGYKAKGPESSIDYDEKTPKENILIFGWNDNVDRTNYSENDLPAVVEYNSDTNSLIFTVANNKATKLKALNSSIEVVSTNLGRFDLFDNGATSSDSSDAAMIASAQDNRKSIGTKLFSMNGEEAVDINIKRNSDGQIYFYQSGKTSTPSLVTFDDYNKNLNEEEQKTKKKEKYQAKDITNLFGNMMTEEDFENNNLKSGEYRCMLQKIGNPEISASKHDMVIFTAKEKGSGTTDIGIEIYTSYSPFAVDGKVEATHYIDLYVNGIKKESWEDVSYKRADDNYFEKLINKDPDNGGSAYVTVSSKKNETDEELNVPDTAELVAGGIVYLGTAINEKSIKRTDDIAANAYDYYDYAVGNDGIPVNTNDLFCEAMNTEDSGLSNKDLYSWHILITPDNITQEVQESAIALCEYMEDAMYIADPPQGLSRKGVIDWHNGKSEYRDTPFNSNFVATYWPWCKVYDSSVSEYVWVMPSVIRAAQYCKVDKDYAPWYAPAGETNGYLSTVIDIESLPNKTDRDALYLDQNRVNPLLKLRNGNILAYGEKTTQRKNSTLTKIHTRRMLIALKKELSAAIKGYVFQPTATENISKIKANVQAIMEQYKAGGGVASYTVICDGTNNTTETLQQDILNIAIACVPVGCIEQVEISFTLNKSE